jgi:predicted nucleotidyltransferase
MNKIKLIKVKKVDNKLLQEIVNRIVKKVNPLKIVLFGSWAYGKPTKSSDLDILVIMDNDIKSRRAIAGEIYNALCGILIPKDIVVVTLKDVEEWKNVPQAFITTIIKKGKLIYERKGRLG